MNGHLQDDVRFEMEVKEMYLNQGLSEKRKDGTSILQITKNAMNIYGRDFAGKFHVNILLTQIQDVEINIVYIDGLRRYNKNYININALMDGYLWRIGLKVKDTQVLFNAMQLALSTIAPVLSELAPPLIELPTMIPAMSETSFESNGRHDTIRHTQQLRESNI